jgi:hypothetical protein
VRPSCVARVLQELQLKVTTQLADLQRELEEGRAATVQAAADKASLTAQLAAAERAKGVQWAAIGICVQSMVGQTCSCWQSHVQLV